MTIIHARPISGSSANISQVSDSVPSTETKIVDGIEAKAVQWVVTLESGTKYQSYNVQATKQNTNSTHSVYGIVGDQVDHGLEVVVNNDNLELEITNNEPVTLNATIVSIKVL